MDGPSRQSKNESCLTVTYLILLDVNSKTSVMYFKSRLMSVFESISLVFNQGATMIQFFVILPTVCIVHGLDWIGPLSCWIGLDWILQNGPMSNSAPTPSYVSITLTFLALAVF